MLLDPLCTALGSDEARTFSQILPKVFAELFSKSDSPKGRRRHFFIFLFFFF